MSENNTSKQEPITEPVVETPKERVTTASIIMQIRNDIREEPQIKNDSKYTNIEKTESANNLIKDKE